MSLGHPAFRNELDVEPSPAIGISSQVLGLCQHRSLNIFKNSISRCRNSSAPRKMSFPQPLRNPHKDLRKPLSNLHKNLRKPMKMPRPHLNAGGYLLSTSLFQNPGIPLPMALGLGSRLNGCIQSYTGTTTKITNISPTNTSTTTTTTTERTTSLGYC